MNLADPFTPTYIKPLEKFDFRTDFARWIKRFERYMCVVGLDKESGREKVNALVYFMGSGANALFSLFGLTDEEASNYELVKERFAVHFTPRFNIIQERVQFHHRVQQPNESIDDFVTDLYVLSGRCDYGIFRDDMIRDQLVAGIFDKNVSDLLQMDWKLTLGKAISLARDAESCLGHSSDDDNQITTEPFPAHEAYPHQRQREIQEQYFADVKGRRACTSKRLFKDECFNIRTKFKRLHISSQPL